MNKETKFINHLHLSTKRNYLERVNNKKPKFMKNAKKYSFDYWDGTRKQGYGGYKYIPNRWDTVINNLIDYYKLPLEAKILDIGCGKGFFLYDFLKLRPKSDVNGIDISSYALKNSKN